MPPTAVASPRWWSLFDPRTRHGQIYLVLLALRCYSALFGYGYIHPDEWMQSGEPYFGLMLPGIDVELPWEWRPDHALRSISTLHRQYLVVDALSKIVRRLGSLSGHSLFLIQRANMLLWTLLLDISVALVLPPQTARYVHYLFGISTSATAFLVRPLSNSHESHLIAFCLLQLLSFYKDRKWYKLSAIAGMHWGVFLATVAVDGFFTRFTFAIFALPLAIFFLYRLASIAAGGYRRPALMTLVITAIVTLMCVWSTVDVETVQYTKLAKLNGYEVASLWGTGWVIPPLNALLYNVKTDNVAQHGLHPRWLHAVVNLPMMVGVANVGVVVMYGWHFVRNRRSLSAERATSEAGRRQGEKEGERIQHSTGDAPSNIAISPSQPGASSTASLPTSVEEEAPYIDLEPITITLCLGTIVFPLLVLSLSPHQEPRFLLALVFPSTVIMAYALQSPLLTSRPRLLRTLCVLHVVQHTLQLVLFSFLHQGGLLPALFDIDTSIAKLPFTGDSLFERYEHHLVYRTFSVPFHFLPRKGTGLFPRVEHFTSESTPAYIVHSASIACNFTWVYAPTWIVPTLEAEADKQGRVQLVKVGLFGGHVDMDHLGESWQAVARVGFKEAFAIQKLEVQCLTGKGASQEEQQQSPEHTPPSHQDL
ncbi:hypothetical protein EX895_002082 [Sporisorium graminicola]|uniref:Mannosyltransferase n=1 Tax=Sporisorium graminicola TaxID=280036 RepID=A0A4U7KVZ6_9BASI|nr:hypothetical protein EX895_002082 [Sporisorium graminicola]TKY88841.1 hypothetical protein EX895_002082 [Sporisorium graminicola]